MAKTNPQPEIQRAGEEEDHFDTGLQLRLAASALNRRLQRNGGCDAAQAFWGDEEELDSEEYVDPEFWDPDYETLPEMALINENIFGGL
jgi:hypothetical protein